ncbi:hypothetical protein PHLCEN_2v9441 [Hermanssonia centrifuga]|uniref:Uncharacterized protein n=1 Tax=Hermanssonia centrifuga TaxID=98765 RepID=A0A2R6NQU1_9APHY|nr:hypothetical protein PHLCEN_2v9441 [Hermanssonia centrifuga]
MADNDGNSNKKTSERWERLLYWLETEHGMHVGESGILVECRDSKDGGRGLFAPSSTLFTIPAKAMMNTRTLSSTYPPPADGPSLSAIQLISLHLLLHRPTEDCESLDAMFGPYISTLPRDFDSHPLTWLVQSQISAPSRAVYGVMLECIPPSVSAAIMRLSSRFWEDWRAVVAYIGRNSRTTRKSSRADILSRKSFQEDDCPLTLDYLWAWLNEGECFQGQFVGEVDLQDIVVRLFEQRGKVGQWMKETLEEEQYWGDWTLHSSPTPAHPSYRLMIALRLYYAIPTSIDTVPSAPEEATEGWKKVLTGQAEVISVENEKSWRESLLDICDEIIDRARQNRDENIRKLQQGLSLTEIEPPWLRWAIGNLNLLWGEEMEVAEAVAMSVRFGEEF